MTLQEYSAPMAKDPKLRPRLPRRAFILYIVNNRTTRAVNLTVLTFVSFIFLNSLQICSECF